MHQGITIALDTAKHVFEVHIVGGAGAVVVRQELRRLEVLGHHATSTEFGTAAVALCSTGRAVDLGLASVECWKVNQPSRRTLS